MLGIDMEFLMQACSRPWRKIELGGVSEDMDGAHAIAANHVYVDGEMPFLIAAMLFESPLREEFFGVTVVKDPAAVRRFLEGPYPPHNRPLTRSIEQVSREDLEAFMKAAKQVRVLRHTERICKDVPTLVAIEKGLAIEARGVTLNIAANEAIPMGLKVSVATDVANIGSPADLP